jgi:putative peptidoglycan lipid II flippase
MPTASADRQIAKSVVWMFLFLIVGRSIGALKEVLVAWRFGVSAELDGFLFAFNLAMLLVGLWASVMVSVLVPLVAAWDQRPSASLRVFSRQLLVMTAAAGLFGAALVGLGIPELAYSAVAGLSPLSAKAAADAAWPLASMVFTGLLAGLGSAWLLAAGRHANTLFESVPAIVIAIGLVSLSPTLSTLGWATAAGTLLQCAALAWALGRMRANSSAQVGISEEGAAHGDLYYWGAFRAGLGLMLLAQGLMSLTTVVDQFFAARLGTGSISTLGYASRVAALALSLFATAVSRASLPVFSQLVQSAVDTRPLARRWALGSLAVGSLVCGAGWLLARPITVLLFERQAFTAADSTAVAEVLSILLMQLPPYCAALVLVYWATARRQLHLILVATVCGLAVKILSAWFLMKTHGLNGLALSSVLMYLSTLTVMAWGFLRPGPDLATKNSQV